MFQAAAFKLLGLKGAWTLIATVIIEMFRAQQEITEAPLVLYNAEGEKIDPTVGNTKLKRVLASLFKLLPYFPGWDTYWPAIRTAATEAIAANKEFYTVLTDAFNAAKAASKK